jgi:hypothetical protein
LSFASRSIADSGNWGFRGRGRDLDQAFFYRGSRFQTSRAAAQNERPATIALSAMEAARFSS